MCNVVDVNISCTCIYGCVHSMTKIFCFISQPKSGLYNTSTLELNDELNTNNTTYTILSKTYTRVRYRFIFFSSF